MREPPRLVPVDVSCVLLEGRRLVYFGGSDYFRLSRHPEVRDAATRALAEFGCSAGASRMTTGNVPIYGRLERELARFFGVPAVTLTSAGYTAPLVAAQALAPDHTHVLLDQRAHACLRDAATLTGLPTDSFPHRDPAGLARVLARCGRGARALVLTDGLFTADGEIAPLRDYLAVLGRSGTLLVDDAHGAGVLGRRGRGSAELGGVPLDRVVTTITLSKAFGAYGGAILGPERLRDQVLARSALFTGNTPPPPASAAAALAAIAILRREGRERRRRLHAHAATVRQAIRSAGGSCGTGPGPMLLVSPTTPGAIRRLRRRLAAAGIHPPLIRYPNGPAEEYFRFALSSEHTLAEVAALSRILHSFHLPSDPA